jgi:predicted ATPase
MESEFPRVSVMGSMPVLYAGLLAGVRLEAGQAAQALALLDEVLHAIKEPGVGLYLPEIHRLRGRCLLALDDGRFDGAVREFEAAIATAKRQAASAFQLTAAVDLARAWASVDQAEKGVVRLREAVGLFTGDDVPARLGPARQMLAGLLH